MPRPGIPVRLEYECGCTLVLDGAEQTIYRYECDECRAEAREWLARLVRDEGVQLVLLPHDSPPEETLPVRPLDVRRVPAHGTEADLPS
jgi:hypothetical protein